MMLIIAESILRVLTSTTPDGNKILFGRQLAPFKLPIKRISKVVDEYNQRMDTSPSTVLLKYDSLLGYRPNPLYASKNYAYNGQGIRVDGKERNAVTEKPAVNKQLRIALFGDSYTHSDEVDFEGSWGSQLEHLLNKSGIDAEVLNFGVFGYGMDQAYLRWKLEGEKYKPDIVIFGFTTVDIKRNYLAAKGLRSEGGNPFTKPRFTIDSNGALQLINSPTVAPNKILANVKKLEDYPFVKANYDYEDLKDKYQNKWFRNSVLLAFAEQILENNRYMFLYQQIKMYDFSREPASLCLKIIDKFASSVEDSGAELIVVDLPKYLDMKTYVQSDMPLPYQAMLDSIKDVSHMVSTIDRFKQHYKEHGHEDLLNLGADSSLFANKGHYSSRGNSIVAASLAEYIISRRVKTIIK